MAIDAGANAAWVPSLVLIGLDVAANGSRVAAVDLQPTVHPKASPSIAINNPQPAGHKAAPRLVEGQITTNWKKALAQLALVYPDRIEPYL